MRVSNGAVEALRTCVRTRPLGRAVGVNQPLAHGENRPDGVAVLLHCTEKTAFGATLKILDISVSGAHECWIGTTECHRKRRALRHDLVVAKLNKTLAHGAVLVRQLEVKVLETLVSAIARVSVGHEQRYLGVLSRHGKQVGVHLDITA